jgi:hypothetical protein
VAVEAICRHSQDSADLFRGEFITEKREAKTQTLGAEAVDGLNPQHPKNAG